MKKIKIISLIMALAVVSICFVGCKDKTQTNNGDEINNNEVISGPVNNEVVSGDEETEEEFIYGEYNELIEVIPEEIKPYAGAINLIGLFYGESNEVDPKEYGVSSLIAERKGTKNPLSTLGYALIDVNGDEKEEFLIYDLNAEETMKNVIISLYTLSGDAEDLEIHHILNSFSTDIYELYENNVLKLSITGEDVDTTIYCNIDESLKIVAIERIEKYERENGTVSIMHYVGGEQEGTEISEAELHNIEGKYLLKSVDIFPIIMK